MATVGLDFTYNEIKKTHEEIMIEVGFDKVERETK